LLAGLHDIMHWMGSPVPNIDKFLTCRRAGQRIGRQLQCVDDTTVVDGGSSSSGSDDGCDIVYRFDDRSVC